MQTILPGEPQAKLQAVSTARWKDIRLVVYISGNAVVVLSGPHKLLQTIYLDQCDELVAIVVDETTGNLAACSAEEIYIYKPYGGDEGALRWNLSITFSLPRDLDQTACLSWGSEEELLVGTSSLNLYQTSGSGREIWRQDLPKPAKYSFFSPDANLVASIGWHDRNIKIWRRQSSDPEDTRFDFTYLPHPNAVTAIQWRQPPQHEHHHYEQIVDDVLYSVCIDSQVRIWAASDPHGISHMQLWAQLDMQECLQPRQLGSTDQDMERFVFFIHQDDFSRASKQALDDRDGKPNSESHARDHLAEIAKIKPDICVVLDRLGNMSAWGLENVGCKARKESDVFNVAHVQDFDLNFKHSEKWLLDSNVAFSCFLTHDSASSLSLVIHHFDGRISWRETKVDRIFDPSPRSDRVQLRSEWTGHRNSIRNLVRDQDGRSLLSRSDDNKVLVWKREHHAADWLLERRSTVSSEEEILDSCILSSDGFVVTLSRSHIALWDARVLPAAMLARCFLETSHARSLLLLPPNSTSGSLQYYIATINPNKTGSLWSCDLQKIQDSLPVNQKSSGQPLQRFGSFKIDSKDLLVSLRGINPMGSQCLVSKSEGTFIVKHCLVGHTALGKIHLWTLRVSQKQKRVDFVKAAVVTTYIKNASFLRGSSTAKVALVDTSKTSLTIWDMGGSQLEYERSFDPLDQIEDLDWTYTSYSQSLLAVRSPYKVTVLGQMRYAFSSKAPSWTAIREINTKDLTTHPVGDSLWLSSGNMVIGAGNQIFVCSEAASLSDETTADLDVPKDLKTAVGILDVISALNTSLSLYHPGFVAQLAFAGKIELASGIMMALLNAMKYYAPGDEMDSFLSVPLKDIYASSSSESTAGVLIKEEDVEDDEFTELNALKLDEMISGVDVPYLTLKEQLHLVKGTGCLAAANKFRQAMDENAKRYFFCFTQRKLRSRHEPVEDGIPWFEITWAMHSISQDILVDQVIRQYQGRLSLEQAEDCGMLLWLADRNGLESQFENVARNEYTKTDEKNPIDCSLYYLALKKKSVLLGLWRMATWNREQQGTQKLLKNDFSQPRWKTAALKNAYALLGKRRFAYAAAWFLLAGNLQDAVNVCLNQIGDLQLAIAIARVYGGDEGSVLRSLIKDKVLQQAATEGNRWQATWAFTMLGQHDMAIRALIEPLHDLIPLPDPPLLQAHSYLRNEPALIHLYQHLRGKYLQKPNACFPISPKTEWDFVIRTARTYDRMGCGLLALDLVRNWKFVQPPKTEEEGERITPAANDKKERRKSGRRKSSATSVAATPKSPVKAEPTMFKEPDASSLLDSFGF